MARRFCNKLEIDTWYSDAIYGLRRALRTEIEHLGSSGFHETRRYTHYQQTLESLSQIKAAAYDHLRIRQKPKLLDMLAINKGLYTDD